MGQLIKGDPRGETLYSMEEISRVTGIKKHTLRSRRLRLGIEATRKGYTYQQIVQMIRKPKVHNAPDSRRMDELASALKKDGFLKERQA